MHYLPSKSLPKQWENLLNRFLRISPNVDEAPAPKLSAMSLNKPGTDEKKPWIRRSNGPTTCVTWFGAKGDGVTDDTAAFAKAIANAAVVIVPPGVYRATIAIRKDNFSLAGAGSEEVTIKTPDELDANVLEIGDGNARNTFRDYTNLSIRGLTLDGNNIHAPNSSTVLSGLGASGNSVTHTFFEDVRAVNWGKGGIGI